MAIGLGRMGPARKKLRWVKGAHGQSYTAEHNGVRYAVIWQYANQWVVRVNSYVAPHVFSSAAAAKRYAAGGEIRNVGQDSLRAALRRDV